MAEVKLNIGFKGKSKKVIKENIKFLEGKKIGEKFKGEGIDMSGYEFEITGGSDSSGFPMRNDVEGSGRKRVLIASGTGLRIKPRKGFRTRKTVAGNTIHSKTAQVNLKVIKIGKENIFVEPKKEVSKEEIDKESEKTPEKK